MSLMGVVLFVTAGQAQSLLDRYASEPRVGDLMHAAVREASLHPERARSWMRRARIAPWLPQVSVRLDRGFEYDRSVDDGPTGQRSSVDTDDDTGWRVQASWDLGRLVFEPNELGVAREGMNLVELRHMVLRQVVQLYFERRRLQAQVHLDPESPVEGAILRVARIQEIEAELDALTGGAMSRGLRSRTR